MNGVPIQASDYFIAGGVAAFFLIFRIIAWWKIFKKGGEKGWKALIPFYNYYVQIKLTWHVRFFWIMIACLCGYVVCNVIFQLNYNPRVMLGLIPGICAVATLVFSIALFVFYIISEYRLCKAFGHGGGWTVGLIFLNFIFIMMLGFGKSKYQGNVYLKEM
ncbi:MAG: DUF5684 domain-containing protein [Coriobacteriia bacterium]|nr:DUF5684 domain-containing protein [Coriobacteriia bacterium]